MNLKLSPKGIMLLEAALEARAQLAGTSASRRERSRSPGRVFPLEVESGHRDRPASSPGTCVSRQSGRARVDFGLDHGCWR